MASCVASFFFTNSSCYSTQEGSCRLTRHHSQGASSFPGDCLVSPNSRLKSCVTSAASHFIARCQFGKEYSRDGQNSWQIDNYEAIGGRGRKAEGEGQGRGQEEVTTSHRIQCEVWAVRSACDIALERRQASSDLTAGTMCLSHCCNIQRVFTRHRRGRERANTRAASCTSRQALGGSVRQSKQELPSLFPSSLWLRRWIQCKIVVRLI